MKYFPIPSIFFSAVARKYEILIRCKLLCVSTEASERSVIDVRYSFELADMNIETYRNYCLRKKGVTEEFPFDKNSLVYKVMGKMFTLADIDTFESINLKCNPTTALQLREMYGAVTPGYHMNKRHWNTVRMDGSIPDKTIYRWIDDSYELVVGKLSQRDRAWLAQEAS